MKLSPRSFATIRMTYSKIIMKIIVGLGNPGQQYENTRHNVGFALADKIKETWAFPDFEFNKKFNAEISKGNRELSTVDRELLLVKPQGFMNLSGESVRAILDFYKLTADDLIVIHDDLDIPLKKYKVATDSSSAGHNGVQNIIDQLGTGEATEEGAIKCRLGAHDFVLDKFSEEETKKIQDIENNILEEVKKLL